MDTENFKNVSFPKEFMGLVDARRGTGTKRSTWIQDMVKRAMAAELDRTPAEPPKAAT